LRRISAIVTASQIPIAANTAQNAKASTLLIIRWR